MVNRIKSGMLLLLLIGLTSSRLPAQSTGFGIGIIAGEPTGICVKNWISSNAAIDGAVAWSYGGHMHLHADYIMHNFYFLSSGATNFPLYFGLGARIRVGHDFKVGVRIPLGIEYMFKTAPFDVFLELVPILDLVPVPSFWPNAAIGVRFYFK